ncbi:putative toxin-antitoxin system toxin component, PIN family [Hydrogenophaga sp.]|uniref:putative toxin-antitoxin system toxin component, PIN family n=1 Tax=Hydrogenophaga sp. TaxID=1904254 RepID=UPI002FCA23D6
MRVVLDTNLLVSAVISPGVPRQLLDAARTGAFEPCTSEVLLAELQEVLQRSHLSKRLEQAGVNAEALVQDLRAIFLVVAPEAVPRVVPSDPDDDHVLAAALAAGADLIASGDRRDLLPMGNYEGIPIVTARDALQRIGQPEPPA